MHQANDKTACAAAAPAFLVAWGDRCRRSGGCGAPFAGRQFKAPPGIMNIPSAANSVFGI